MSLFVPQPRATVIAEIAFELLPEVGCLAADATHPTGLSTQVSPHSVFVVFAIVRDSHRRLPYFQEKSSCPVSPSSTQGGTFEPLARTPARTHEPTIQPPKMPPRMEQNERKA